MNSNLRQSPLWVGLTAVLFCLATLTFASEVGAQEPKVRLEVPSSPVGVDDAPFTVQVVVEDVANLGAFEFNLLYEPSILSVVSVERGPFLGSSGRRVECMDPRLRPGFIRFVCVTLGALPGGAYGSGVLAIITFDPIAPGTSPLQFERAMLVLPEAELIPSTTEDSSITITAPSPQETPLPTDTPPPATPTAITPVEATPVEATPAQATPVQPTPARATPTLTTTPATTASTSDGGTNWALWGAVIGGAAGIVAAAAGIVWWSRARKAA